MGLCTCHTTELPTAHVSACKGGEDIKIVKPQLKVSFHSKMPTQVLSVKFKIKTSGLVRWLSPGFQVPSHVVGYFIRRQNPFTSPVSLASMCPFQRSLAIQKAGCSWANKNNLRLIFGSLKLLKGMVKLIAFNQRGIESCPAESGLGVARGRERKGNPAFLIQYGKLL